MSARIEVQIQCGSCDRIEWCEIFTTRLPHADRSNLIIRTPDGWLIEPGPYPTKHLVQCPDHRRLA